MVEPAITISDEHAIYLCVGTIVCLILLYVIVVRCCVKRMRDEYTQVPDPSQEDESSNVDRIELGAGIGIVASPAERSPNKSQTSQVEDRANKSAMSASSSITDGGVGGDTAAVALTKTSTNTHRRTTKKASGKKAAAATRAAAAKAASANAYMQEIDYFVRHREDFHAIGFYYSVNLLERLLPPPPSLKIKSLRDFLRKRSEVRMLTNLSAFKLVTLTPFREANIQVHGSFQCVGVACRFHWESACTYADHYQKCHRCDQRVYPYEQRPLEPEELEEYKANPVDENYVDYDEIAYLGKRDAFDPNLHPHAPHPLPLHPAPGQHLQQHQQQQQHGPTTPSSSGPATSAAGAGVNGGGVGGDGGWRGGRIVGQTPQSEHSRMSGVSGVSDLSPTSGLLDLDSETDHVTIPTRNADSGGGSGESVDLPRSGRKLYSSASVDTALGGGGGGGGGGRGTKQLTRLGGSAVNLMDDSRYRGDFSASNAAPVPSQVLNKAHVRGSSSRSGKQ